MQRSNCALCVLYQIQQTPKKNKKTEHLFCEIVLFKVIKFIFSGFTL